MTDETKNPQEAKIKHGMGARRSFEAFQTQRDIVIPKGTILRHVKDDEFAAPIGLTDTPGTAALVLTLQPAAQVGVDVARVVAS